jgi:hypothetical protein
MTNGRDQEQEYECCQCDADVSPLVARACARRITRGSAGGGALITKIDVAIEPKTVYVTCPNGHTCEYDCAS